MTTSLSVLDLEVLLLRIACPKQERRSYFSSVEDLLHGRLVAHTVHRGRKVIMYVSCATVKRVIHLDYY